MNHFLKLFGISSLVLTGLYGLLMLILLFPQLGAV